MGIYGENLDNAYFFVAYLIMTAILSAVIFVKSRPKAPSLSE